MKVLFITHNVPRYAGDAAGSFVLRLAISLRAIGVEVDVLAPGAAGLAPHDVIDGVSIHRVRYASDSAMTLAYTGTMAEAVRSSWAGKLALFGLMRHMRHALRKHIRIAARDGTPYDIVHAHWWFPSGLIALSAGVGRGGMPPFVVTMHGSDVRLAQSVRPSHRVMRSVLNRARAVTAVSQWLATRATAIVPDANVAVSPMPVDTSLFAEPSSTRARAGVLFVGRLNAQKGLADLLDAFALVQNKSAQLNVVGDGPDTAPLRARAQQLGIAERVSWYGALKQHELVPLYQNARVVAIPSREEGLGLVAVEAQLCATPVIAYDSGGLPDVVRTDAGGTLVQPGNIAALTAALNRFVADDESSAHAVIEAGAAARSATLHQFSPETVARRYADIYSRASTARSTNHTVA